MKTKIYLGLSITAVVAMMMACNSRTNSKQEGVVDDHQTEVTEPVTVKHSIPVADIKDMVEKYKNERVDMAKGAELTRSYGPQFKDSKCVWFSIDELKEFLKEAESQPVKPDGVRVYFTVYPEKKEGESGYMNSIPAEARNHVTLVMVPTFYDSKTQVHSDFEPLPFAGTNQEGFNEGGKEGGAGGAAAAAPAQAAQSIIALNHGALCPPNCPSAGSSFISE